MEIRTKEQLIKKLQKIGERKIEQGVLFKELALSIKHYKEQKSLSEWLKIVQRAFQLEGKEVIKK